MKPKPTKKSRGVLTRLKAFSQLDPARWFVIFAVLFGVGFAVITPPFGTPDEYAHFLRAHQIAEGDFLPTKNATGTGGVIPLSFPAFGDASRKFTLDRVDELDNIKINDGGRAFIRFENTSLYSPVAYAPQATGILIGKVLDLPVIYLTYVARIFNVLAYAAVFYLVIRMMPFAKWAAAVLGLLPMHVLLSGTISADPFSAALAALVVAVVLRLRTLTRSLSRKELLLLFGLTAVVSLAKLPFLLFLALYFLIPKRVFGGSVKRWLITLASLFGTALLFGGVWLVVAKLLSSPYGPAYVNTPAQLHFMLEHPGAFLHAMADTYMLTNFGAGFIQQYVASIGLLQTWPPLWLTVAYTIFLAFTLYPIKAAAGALQKYEKLLVAAIGVTCATLTSALLYLSWTKVGAPYIDGVQVRYFTPLLILLIPLLSIRAASTKQTQEGSLRIAAYRYMPVVFLVIVFGVTLQWFYR